MAQAPLWIKICGVTSIDDALMIAEAGADAIGLNFAPPSPRAIGEKEARAIVRAGGKLVEWVGVFVDADEETLQRTQAEVGLDRLQLHGAESPELVERLGARAFKAVSIGAADDVERARSYGGDRVLVDAKVEGSRGGTGASFDWSLLEPLLETRRVVLAGGLRPDNIAQAVTIVRPFGIDTASGVESAPGQKDARLVREFISAARQAWALSAGRT